MLSNFKAKAHADQDSQRESFRADVLVGLNATRKSLNPKYFYDRAGSELFSRITDLPEYYVTRTEVAIMRQAAQAIGEYCANCKTVVEFGSGSGRRSDILLNALQQVRSYVPIDVSDALLETTRDLVESRYPQIKVDAVLADFTGDVRMPTAVGRPCLGFLPGSTIGNFAPVAATRLLQHARKVLGAGSQLLLGVDLIKPTQQLERAYDDAQGVTAAFNLNLLARINAELDADFNLENFVHQVFYNQEFARIEMHLASLVDQQVTIDGEFVFSFYAGESIHTENSHKYSIDSFQELAVQAGWRPATFWVDDDRLFSVHLLQT